MLTALLFLFERNVLLSRQHFFLFGALQVTVGIGLFPLENGETGGIFVTGIV